MHAWWTNKALTLWRPWPYAVTDLGKRVENRSRADGTMPQICRYRGWLLLHAGKKWDEAAVHFMMERGLIDAQTGLEIGSHAERARAEAMRPGGIVGIARAVGHIEPVEQGAQVVIGVPAECPRYVSRDDTTLDLKLNAVQRSWWTGGWALLLDDVWPLPFVACRGQQGIWTVDDETLKRLDDRVALHPTEGRTR